MFPAFESVHVIAITLVVGTVMVVDLRVLGLASRKQKVSELTGAVLPWTWIAFVAAAISGAFIFAAKAHVYFDNFHFRAKMLLMALAFVNMLIFHYGPFRSVSAWDSDNQAPSAARISCGLSLGFWILIVGMGRWIGFSIEG
jgi:hypothetical protein